MIEILLCFFFRFKMFDSSKWSIFHTWWHVFLCVIFIHSFIVNQCYDFFNSFRIWHFYKKTTITVCVWNIKGNPEKTNESVGLLFENIVVVVVHTRVHPTIYSIHSFIHSFSPFDYIIFDAKKLKMLLFAMVAVVILGFGFWFFSVVENICPSNKTKILM